MKVIFTSILTSVVFGIILITPSWAETTLGTLKKNPAQTDSVTHQKVVRPHETFSALKSVETEVLSAHEMAKVQGTSQFSGPFNFQAMISHFPTMKYNFSRQIPTNHNETLVRDRAKPASERNTQTDPQ